MKTNMLRILLSFFLFAGTAGVSYATGGGNATTAPTDDVLATTHAAKPLNLNEVLASGKLPSLDYLPHSADLTFKIRIDENGHYVTHKTLKSNSDYMAKYIGKQLHKLRFTPAVQGDKTVASWIVLPVRIQ